MGNYNKDTWEPRTESAKILNRAMEHIKSVPYTVSMRWVFYRLLQDGIYKTKKDYKDKWGHLASKARHCFWNGWHPEIMSDETRSMIQYITEGNNPEPDVNNLIKNAKSQAEYDLNEAKTAYEDYKYYEHYPIDPKRYQDYILLILFEARAMESQFRHYTKGITLCPFGGQPSIPYKFEIAKYIEQEYQKYRKDVIVLYFGDADKSGQIIYKTGVTDITEWASVPIDFQYLGLTEKQAQDFGVPTDPEKGGYQWEALTDDQAREIITSGTSKYFNDEAMSMAKAEQKRIEDAVEDTVNEYVDEMREDN